VVVESPKNGTSEANRARLGIVYRIPAIDTMGPWARPWRYA
jgi:hypothetical protein